jgi:hypothetical protein
LKSLLSAPTNNNNVVTKGYVDSLIPDLSNYLTTDNVYVNPQLPPIDGEPVDQNDSLLVTKKYVDDLFKSLH